MLDQTFEEFMSKVIPTIDKGKLKFNELEQRPINYRQAEFIRNSIIYISKTFAPESDVQLISKNLYNKLKVKFNIKVLEKLPECDMGTAVDVLIKCEIELRAFTWYIRQLQKTFVESVIRNGDPWTPAIQAKWTKNLSRELPDRPNWKQLATAINNMKNNKSEFVRPYSIIKNEYMNI